MKQVKRCLYCNKEFKKPINESQKDWINRHKYCSRECSYKGKIGTKTNSEEFKKHLSEKMKGNKYRLGKEPWNKGLKITQTKGKGNGMWKGDKVGYFALHRWVDREKGKPKQCEECGKTREEAKIEWANIDHKYRRNTNDYKALCKKCHRKFDINYNNWKNINKNI